MNWPTINAELHERALTVTDEVFLSHFVRVPTHLSSWTESLGYLTGKSVLHYGSRNGLISAGTALFHAPKLLVGMDSYLPGLDLLERLSSKIGVKSLPDNLQFVAKADLEQLQGIKFDFIFSWSVFEFLELSQIEKVVAGLYERLNLGGRVLIQLGRPYYSSLGSHLADAGIKNWEHLSLPCKDLYAKVMEAPGLSPDAKADFWVRFLALNKLTPHNLQSVFQKSGFFLAKSYELHANTVPPPELLDIYLKDSLTLEQSVMLFVKA